jgi:ParB-like chromosome segregation protein Spo0J
MELEPRTTAPSHATGAVAFVPLAELSADVTFRLREEGDVAALAASIGRLGQLVPVELRPLPGAVPGGPRWQVVAGFRRLAALRLLYRERVLARVHEALDDDDAWAIALAQPLLAEPLLRAELEALRSALPPSAAGWAAELLDEAAVRAPVDAAVRERFLEFLQAREERGGTDREDAPEEGGEAAAPDEPVEVTLEELAADVAARFYEVNQDLALALERWRDLPAEDRRAIAAQARWAADVLPLLEDGDRDT